MEVFGYLIQRGEDVKMKKMTFTAGYVYVFYDVEKRELSMVSKVGRINALDIMKDMFGTKDLFEGHRDRVMVKNKDEIHFRMLLSRLNQLK